MIKTPLGLWSDHCRVLSLACPVEDKVLFIVALDEFFGLGGRSLGDLDRQVLEFVVLTNTGSWSDHGVIVFVGCCAVLC